RRAYETRTALGAIRLSFLAEPDEPVRRPPRRPPVGSPTDRKTLMVRRPIAIGGAVIAFILIVLLFRGCLDARKERAMEDYLRDTNELLAAVPAQRRRVVAL